MLFTTALLKMQHLQHIADENKVIFDLNDIFNDSTVEMQQIESEEIPDEIIKDILDEELSITSENSIQPKGLDPRSTCTTPDSKKRFKFISKEGVDEIASKRCKKKTHKQTTWGVKVFRGEKSP